MPTLGGSAAIMAAKRLGVRIEPYLTYNFLVEIEGIIVAGFTEVSGLGIETQTITKRFGGENDIEYKFITGTKYSDLVLRNGITDFDLLWSWYESVIKGKFSRKNGSIYLLDHMGVPAAWWDFMDACPVKWDGPQFDAQKNMVATQTLVLNHKGLTRPGENLLLSAGRRALAMAVPQKPGK